MRALKIWGGHNVNSRIIVAAHTKKEALERLAAVGIPVSLHEFNGYWAETGNRAELIVVSGQPGVWSVNEYHVSRLNTSADYKPLEKKA